MMKAKVTTNFVDKIESAEQGKEVLRKVGDEFTVSKERFDEIKNAGNYVEEVKSKKEPKKLVKDDDHRGTSSGTTESGVKSS